MVRIWSCGLRITSCVERFRGTAEKQEELLQHLEIRGLCWMQASCDSARPTDVFRGVCSLSEFRNSCKQFANRYSRVLREQHCCSRNPLVRE